MVYLNLGLVLFLMASFSPAFSQQQQMLQDPCYNVTDYYRYQLSNCILGREYNDTVLCYCISQYALGMEGSGPCFDRAEWRFVEGNCRDLKCNTSVCAFYTCKNPMSCPRSSAALIITNFLTLCSLVLVLVI